MSFSQFISEEVESLLDESQALSLIKEHIEAPLTRYVVIEEGITDMSTEYNKDFQITCYNINCQLKEQKLGLIVGLRQNKKTKKYGIFVAGEQFKDKIKRTPFLKSNQLFSEVEVKTLENKMLIECIDELFSSSKIHKILDFYKKHY